MATGVKPAIQNDHKWPFEYLSGHEAERDFPTWVPDFHKTKHRYMGLRPFSDFRAGKRIWLAPSFLDDGRSMRVSAIKIGVVEVIHKQRDFTTMLLEPEDVLQASYGLVMTRAVIVVNPVPCNC